LYEAIGGVFHGWALIQQRDAQASFAQIPAGRRRRGEWVNLTRSRPSAFGSGLCSFGNIATAK
jgi:hypothetical protein